MSASAQRTQEHATFEHGGNKFHQMKSTCNGGTSSPGLPCAAA
jgi:hypothetical protein